MNKVAIATFLLSLITTISTFASQKVNTNSEQKTFVVELSKPQNDNSSVIFYFWPGSASCYKIDIALQKWQEENPQFNIKRVPIVLRPHWRLLAKTWLVSQSLKMDDIFLDNLYQYLHIAHKPINTITDLKNFLIEQQLDVDQFLHLFHSYTINEQLKTLQKMSKKLPISGVPTIIKGKWLIDAKLANTTTRMISALNNE